MNKLNILRVFTDKEENHGNPIGIIIDTQEKYSDSDRQKIAFNSGFSEVVFIDDLDNRKIRIFARQQEIPFAGHAVIGVVFFFEQYLQTVIKKVICINISQPKQGK